MIPDRDDVKMTIAIDVANLVLRVPLFLLGILETIGALDQGDGSSRCANTHADNNQNQHRQASQPRTTTPRLDDHEPDLWNSLHGTIIARGRVRSEVGGPALCAASPHPGLHHQFGLGE